MLYSQTVEKRIATSIFESLSSGVRLDVFRLLVKKGTEGMVAGDLAAAVSVPPTNLSFHLKALTQARLLEVEQEGRYLRYRANIPLMLDLVAYLTEECCSGNPGQCVDLRASSKVSPGVLPPMVAGRTRARALPLSFRVEPSSRPEKRRAR